MKGANPALATSSLPSPPRQATVDAQNILVTDGVTYAPASGLANPLTGGEVRGQILLQGTNVSLGSYAELGDEMAFTDRNGHFRLTAPAGEHNIVLKAPAHLPATITGVTVAPGRTSNISPVTLFYGDANRDSVITMQDLTLAVANFGKAAVISLFGEE